MIVTENSVLPMVAVGISLGLLLVIASSVIGIFIWRLRRYEEVTPTLFSDFEQTKYSCHPSIKIVKTVI